MLVLLPPSEGKAQGGSGPSRREAGDGRFAELAPHRAELVARIDPAIDDLPTLPAIERYSGVLSTAMAYRTLDGWSRRRAEGAVVIFSGLWGVLAPSDPIPDYKLPMGSSLPGIGGLAPWWRHRLSPVVDAHVDGQVVWDLLPGVHANAWDDAAQTYRARWRVRVVRESADGQRTTVSHDNKATKGYLARHLVRTTPRSPTALLDLDLPGGYRIDASDPDWTRRGGLVEIVQSWRG